MGQNLVTNMDAHAEGNRTITVSCGQIFQLNIGHRPLVCVKKRSDYMKVGLHETSY